MDTPVGVIVNPAAGRGRGARAMPAVATAFAELGQVRVRATTRAGEERSLARQLIADGCETLVAVGGDGTTGNVADAILHSRRDVRLAVMPAGTGNDFAKVLGTERLDARAVARLCEERSEIRADAGRIEDVHFVNCCGFGFDVAVLQGTERTRWLRGKAVYLYTAVRQLFRYPGMSIAIKSSPVSLSEPKLHMLLLIANAPHFGGAFHIAPGASVTDGQLDAVSIFDVATIRRLEMLVSATRGTHIEQPECVVRRAARFELSFEEPPVYETDGELNHARSARLTVSSLPAALRVVAAPGAPVWGASGRMALHSPGAFT